MSMVAGRLTDLRWSNEVYVSKVSLKPSHMPTFIYTDTGPSSIGPAVVA